MDLSVRRIARECLNLTGTISAASDILAIAEPSRGLGKRRHSLVMGVGF